MKHSYPDILALASVPPAWYDANGTPRYAPHHPDLCPNIYAKVVVLVVIECQDCQREFIVQQWLEDSARRKCATLENLYGDPPPHDDDGKGPGSLVKGHPCMSGDTMTAVPVRIIEYWRSTDCEWSRVPAEEGRDIRPEWSKE